MKPNKLTIYNMYEIYRRRGAQVTGNTEDAGTCTLNTSWHIQTTDTQFMCIYVWVTYPGYHNLLRDLEIKCPKINL